MPLSQTLDLAPDPPQHDRLPEWATFLETSHFPIRTRDGTQDHCYFGWGNCDLLDIEL